MRRIRLDDAAGWKGFNNAIAKRMLLDTPPQRWSGVPSIVYARNEIHHYDDDWQQGSRYVYSVVDRTTGKIIGDFHVEGIDAVRHRAEYGHALHPRVWGTGITYETLDAVKRAARAKGILLWGKVEPENVRSWKSLEKYGATFTGEQSFTINKRRKKMRVYELR